MYLVSLLRLATTLVKLLLYRPKLILLVILLTALLVIVSNQKSYAQSVSCEITPSTISYTQQPETTHLLELQITNNSESDINYFYLSAPTETTTFYDLIEFNNHTGDAIYLEDVQINGGSLSTQYGLFGGQTANTIQPNETYALQIYLRSKNITDFSFSQTEVSPDDNEIFGNCTTFQVSVVQGEIPPVVDGQNITERDVKLVALGVSLIVSGYIIYQFRWRGGVKND